MSHRGFTLLEVTVALAILALGLVAVVDINTSATRLHEASQHITLATMLARSKLVDLEFKLNQDGFSDFDKEIDGTFEEEKHPEMRWKAEILKPDLTKSVQQITGLISGAMGGAGGTGGLGGLAGAAGGGSSALASLLGQSALIQPGTQLPDTLSSSSSSAPSSPTTTGLGGMLGGAASGIIQSQVQMLVQQIQQGVREVRLTVFWPEGRQEGSFTVTTHFVVLTPLGSDTGTSTPFGQGSQTGIPGPGGMSAPGAGSIGGALGSQLGNLGMPGGGFH
ncbi:MAG TPA: prepilin-type N-terminal cleavage/methylation domain-containing protein [Myxococcales bacterium]|nr:prepilin-type N-terminal cleavage/methylation domain-containing protein [Myxococcales bacterium]